MNPKNRPPFAPNLAQKAKQPQQRAHGFKPVVAQLKTVAPAQNVKLPPQSLKVLQPPRHVAQIPRPPVNAPAIMRKPARPAAPPVYKPQPVPKVMQQKSAAGSPKPFHPRAVQLKTFVQHARPANTQMHAATTRARVVQMAKAEVKVEPKKITAKGLKVDDYLFVEAAGGGEAEAPAFTEVKMKVLILRKGDVDYKLTAVPIEAALKNPEPARNSGSDSANHQNLQRRLPHYSGMGKQPNLEYKVDGLGASRIVVDLMGKTVYLSYHYGDSSAGEGTIPKQFVKGNISAFVELDPATWDLRAILVDARKWWDLSYDDPPGH